MRLREITFHPALPKSDRVQCQSLGSNTSSIGLHRLLIAVFTYLPP